MVTLMKLNEEKFNEEWEFFWTNMQKADIAKYFDASDLKNSLKIASCALSEDTGCAYEGALLVHTNLVTKLALRIAKMVSNTFPIDEAVLLKVCCLMHLSKIEMFVPNDNAWEIEKRGLPFKFATIDGKLKFGERSILMATNMGITFSPIEWEAMTGMDNADATKGEKYFDSILTIIIRQANELAYAIEKNRRK